MLCAPVQPTGHTLCSSESNRFALSTHGQSALPRRGVVLAFPVIDYPLVSVKKIGFPVRLLDASIQLTQLFSQVVCFTLNSDNAHRADKFDLRPSRSSLCRGCSGGEFSIGVQPNLQNVALSECIGQRPRTKLRGGVRLIDSPNQGREFRSAVFKFGL